MRSFVVATAALLAACAPSAADAPIAEQWRAAELEITPAELGAERVGVLQFRGGIALASEDRDFGGWSGVEVLEDGRLIAVSDAGMWFSAALSFDEDGALIGLADARLAPMRDEAGVPFATKEAGDAEGFAQLPDGRFAVSFEQTQTIRIYELNRDGPFGAAVAGPVLEETRDLPPNAGLEALAATADGALLVGAEGGGGPTPLWVARLGESEPAPVRARYQPRDGYSLTALDRLPNGDFVALERFYAPIIGARARVTRFAASALDGDIVVVEVLAEIAPPMPVDNFEGIAAVRMPDGTTRLYIASDDNFSERQRTLLLAFDVVE